MALKILSPVCALHFHIAKKMPLCCRYFSQTKVWQNARWQKFRHKKAIPPLHLHRQFCTNLQHSGPPWRILFLGTDEFAMHHLKALHQEQLTGSQTLINHLDVAICTENCDVRQYADEHNLCVSLWPQLDSAKTYDLGVIVSFGRLIPKEFIDRFPLGMINIHPSLLPAWRGASPIIHTILKGETISGISIMSISPQRFDTGPIVLQKEIPVPQRVSALDLMPFMAWHGSSLLLDCLRQLHQTPREEQLKITPTPYAHKIKAIHSYVNWEKQCVHHIDRHYRAISDLYPLRTKFDGKIVKLLDMEYCSNDSASGDHTMSSVHFPQLVAPGTLFYHKKSNILYVKCKDGWAGFRNLLLKKPMSALAFYNGYLSKYQLNTARFVSVDNYLDYYWD